MHAISIVGSKYSLRLVALVADLAGEHDLPIDIACIGHLKVAPQLFFFLECRPAVTAAKLGARARNRGEKWGGSFTRPLPASIQVEIMFFERSTTHPERLSDYRFILLSLTNLAFVWRCCLAAGTCEILYLQDLHMRFVFLFGLKR